MHRTPSPCEWCGTPHDPAALCQANTVRVTRRSFFGLMTAAVAGFALGPTLTVPIPNPIGYGFVGAFGTDFGTAVSVTFHWDAVHHLWRLREEPWTKGVFTLDGQRALVDHAKNSQARP